jgi:hypothetical protein
MFDGRSAPVPDTVVIDVIAGASSQCGSISILAGMAAEVGFSALPLACQFCCELGLVV